MAQIECQDFSNQLNNSEEESNYIDDQRKVIKTYWPQDNELEIIFESIEERDLWLSNISNAIFNCVERKNRSIGWRHKIRLGTIYSAVIMRDIDLFDKFKELCENGALEYAIFDSQDDEGFTPLHYAIIFRIGYMVQRLLEVGVDVTARDSQGSSPLHWSCLQLDDENLARLCENIFDTDLYDDHGNTPLYLACVGGRDLTGQINYESLHACIASLISLGANVNFIDSTGNSLIQYAVSKWQSSVVNYLIQSQADYHAITPNEENLLHILLNRESLSSNLYLNESCFFYKASKIETKTADEPLDDDLPTRESESLSRSLAADSLDLEFNIGDALRILNILIRNGVSLNLKNNSKAYSPLEIFCQKYSEYPEQHNINIINLLVSHGARPEEAPTLATLQKQDDLIKQAVLNGSTIWNSKGILDGNILNSK